MLIVISGHTGFIGNALGQHFTDKSHRVRGISRKDFAKGVEHLASLIEGADALIHLAGAPILGRWSKTYRQELWNSRIKTTSLLVAAIEYTQQKPGVFLSSSAIGIYPEGGIKDENTLDLEEGFLGKLCQAWESEALKATPLLKTYLIRTGIVLGTSGGALKQMLIPFRLGLGGAIASGTQMMSWIHLQDYVQAIAFIIAQQPALTVFNLTSPHPVPNKTFTRLLAKNLRRPAFFNVPAGVLWLMYGQGAQTLTRGQEVRPTNLLRSGYRFQYPDLEAAFRNLLNS